MNSIDITPWMANWASGLWPSWGVSVDTVGAVQDRWKQLSASENFNSTSHYIDVVYNTPPPAAVASSPADGAVFTSTSAKTLSVDSGLTDTDPGHTLKYKFEVDAGGSVVDSGWQSGTSFPIPEGVLQDGSTYTWRVTTGDWEGANGPIGTKTSAWSRTFRVDLRLGAKPHMPMDAMGPVNINLSNGNVVLSTGSPSMATVGGAVGLSYTYNSQTPSPFGLTGSYYSDCTDPNAWLTSTTDEPELVRRDPTVYFNWINGSHPGSMISADDFCVRWNGSVTLPATATAGNYFFGAGTDDGVKITIDPGASETVALNRWYNQATWPPVYGSSVSMSPGQTRQIKVEYYDDTVTGTIALSVKGPSGTGGAIVDQLVPGSWLSPSAPSLPPGWAVSADLDGSVGYASARVSEKTATLFDPTGATHVFTWTGSGYTSPAEESGVLTKSASTGALTLHADDGLAYTFNSDGTLASVVSAVDDRAPAAAALTWTGSPPRLTRMTDPVSTRYIELFYGGDTGCTGSPPANLAAAPSKMLCKVRYPDGSETRFWYTPVVAGTSQQLARIEDPGAPIVDPQYPPDDPAEVTDFGYTAGLLTSVRDPLAGDVLASGARTESQPCAETCTRITYTGTVASKVELPLALQGDAESKRLTHEYTYDAGSTVVRATNADNDPVVTTAGYDAAGRVTSVTDATGKVSSQTWDSSDRPTSATDPALRRTTTVYDADGRPVESYGPAPSSCFVNGALTPSTACAPTVPKTTTAYDEEMPGLAAAYWTNKNLSGAPSAHGHGVHDPSGRMLVNWRALQPTGLPLANADNWSARYTGKMLFPTTGSHSLVLCADNGVRLWIDDVLLIDGWTDAVGCRTAAYNNTAIGAKRRIRIEHYEATGNADLNLRWTQPGGVQEFVPGANLSPDYGLTTTTTEYGHVVPSTGAATTHVTKTEYARPEFGLPTATIGAPSGSNLRTTTSYENPGNGLLRRKTRTLPAGRDPYTAVVANDSPVGHWRLGESTGATAAADASGLGRHGTYSGVTLGAPGLITGDADPAASFPGGTSGVTLPPGIMQFGKAETVEAWFKTTASGPILGMSTGAPTAAPTNWTPVLYVGTDGKLRGQLWRGSVSPITSTAIVNDGQRHHVMLSSTGDSQSLYLDGVLVGALAGTVDNLAQTTNLIGRAYTSSSWPSTPATAGWWSFSGVIDDVAVYAKALPASQALAHYTAGTTSPVTTRAEYYGAVEAPPVTPCEGESSSQAGFAKAVTGPAPASGTAVGGISVYDDWGRVVSSQRNGETSWSCTKYDKRGRVVEQVIPAYGAEPSRTIVSDHAVHDGTRPNPLWTSVSDGTANTVPVLTKADLLGRPVEYRDAWGFVTTTEYDQLGRAFRSVSQVGEVLTEYDLAGRVTKQSLGTRTLATPTYSTAGELATVEYNGNGTSLSSIARDDAGRTTGLTYLKPAVGGTAPLASDSVTRAVAGEVIDQTVNGAPDVHGGNNYEYDDVGRLTKAWTGTATYAYSFADSSCAGQGDVVAAGRNTNRSSMTVGAAGTNANPVTTGYCYDASDRLTSVAGDARYASPAYDVHGNTTTLGLQAMTYDGADRHATTTARSTFLRYTRDAADRVILREATTASDPGHRASASANNGAGATSVTVNKPAGTASGDVLLAQVSAAGGTGVDVTAPTGWTLVNSTANGTSVRAAVFWKTAGSSEPSTYAFGLSVSSAAVAGVSAYTNVNRTAPVHAFSVSTAANSTAMTATGLTPAVESTRLVELHALAGAATTVPPSGMSERWDQAGTGVAAEAADRSWRDPVATGDRVGTASAAVASVSHLVSLTPLVGTATLRHGHSGPGDSASFTVTGASGAGTVEDRYVGLVGGVLFNSRASNASETWSYPDVHGDVVASASAAGVSSGPFAYSPFGEAAPAGLPNNMNGDYEYGWLGQHQRGTEQAKNIHTIEMGARQYVPGLGRFIEVDPIEGGSANDYEYCAGDPVGCTDLDGRYVDGRHGGWWRDLAAYHREMGPTVQNLTSSRGLRLPSARSIKRFNLKVKLSPRPADYQTNPYYYQTSRIQFGGSLIRKTARLVNTLCGFNAGPSCLEIAEAAYHGGRQLVIMLRNGGAAAVCLYFSKGMRTC